MKDLRERIGAHPFLGNLPAEHIATLSEHGREVSLPPDIILFQEREPATEFYLIEKGSAALEMHIPSDGTTRPLCLAPSSAEASPEETPIAYVRTFCRNALCTTLILVGSIISTGDIAGQTNGTVRFATSAMEISESEVPHISFLLDWSNLQAPAAVSIKVTGGTAKEGQDFTLDRKTFSVSPDNTSCELVITPVADGLIENLETIELSLVDPTASVLVGSPNRLTIVLTDDETTKFFSFSIFEGSRERTTWRRSESVPISVLRRGPATEEAEVHFSTLAGTGKPGVDYEAVSGTLYFGTNETWNMFEIPLLTNNLPDSDFRVLLDNPTPGYNLGIAELTIRIQNDNIGIAIVPKNSNPLLSGLGWTEVSETAGELLLDVVIMGDSNSRPVSVDYRTDTFTAAPGGDYSPASGTVTFLAGESRKTIAIPIINDRRPEPMLQDFRVLLENPKGGLSLSRPRQVEVYIVDNDLGYSIGDFGQTGQLSIDEGSGTVTVNVNRQGDFDMAGSINYRLVGASATLGQDFLPVEGTLQFGATETNKTFTITILQDSLIEGDEDFRIFLEKATGGIPIRTPEIPVVLHDDERNQVRVDPDFKPEWPIEQDEISERVCISPDGKILIATPSDRVTGEPGTLIVRLMPNGASDPTWNVATINTGIALMQLQENNQLLIAPMFSEGFTVNGFPRSRAARLNVDGSLDLQFSPSLPTNSVVTALAIQKGGQILVGTDNPPGLYRVHPSGVLDSTFQPAPFEDFPRKIVETADGGIVLGLGWGSGILRLKSTGTTDETFLIPENASLKAVLPDGRLFVQQFTTNTTYLGRLLPNGAVDPTFAQLISEGSIVPLSDGRLWYLRWNHLDADDSLKRLNPDGSDDPNWPVATLTGLANVWMGAGIKRCPDGNLLAIGVSPEKGLNGQPRRGLARLLVDAPLPRLEVAASSARLSENGGKVSVRIERCGTNIAPFTVDWRTEGGTAKPGFHYLAATGTLTFPANQSTATIQIDVSNNPIPDEDRSIRIRFQASSPENKEFPQVEITIMNDDLGLIPNAIRRFPNGTILLRPTGYMPPVMQSADGVLLEASGNLTNWEPIASVWSRVSPEILDGRASTNRSRFYRLSTWPSTVQVPVNVGTSRVIAR